MRSPPCLPALVAVVALLALPVAACPSADALTLDDMTVSFGADSMSVRVPVAIPAGADSATVTLTLVPGGAKTLTARAQATALVFTFPAAAFGEPFTAQACGAPWWGQAKGATSCNARQAFTRAVPGDTLTWPDSMTLSAALRGAKLVDTALIALTTGETCPAEIRDYHRAMLIASRAGAAQSPNCATVFAEDVARDNQRTLTALALGYPWTAARDSAWRADTTTRPGLPLTRISTRWFPNPMSGDTLVFGGGADNNVPITAYRAAHPGFTWPSGS